MAGNTIIFPSAGSTYTTAGSYPNTAAVAVWLGFCTPLSSSGCVVFFKGASPTAGSEFLPVVASPGQQVIKGPFFMTAGFSTCTITGGSVLVYL